MILTQILSYSLLPKAMPRFRNLLGSGFSNLAYFMALIYRAVNLLPENHPYLRSQSIGKFNVSNVLSEASSNLKFDMKHIDQIIIFGALLVGIFILAAQFFGLLLAFMLNPAVAQDMPENYSEFLTTKDNENDLAFRFLDSVFGVPGIFNSKEPQETPFHTALHSLFQFYSIGLLIIAVMIVIYFIFAILAETAQTGTPFGKRYNHVWAPIRLVAAIGLLIPISYGMNAGQWITLYAAKFGSGLATNGWTKFTETINDQYIPSDELIAKPNLPELRDLAAFMMLAHACREAYYIKKPRLNNDGADSIKAYLIKKEDGVEPEELLGTLYSSAIEYSNNTQIQIRFGHYHPDYADDVQNVYPYCGDLTITITEKQTTTSDGVDKDTQMRGGAFITARYYVLIKDMWEGTGYYAKMAEIAREMIRSKLIPNHPAPEIPDGLKEEVQQHAKDFIDTGVDQAISSLKRELKGSAKFADYGWAGAGIWYNQIAGLNGQLTNAIMNKPQTSLYPAPMEYVCEENKQQDENIDPNSCYSIDISKGKKVQFKDIIDRDTVVAMGDVFNYWYKDTDDLTGNVFIDVINAILGTSGLFDMCKNADIHPLGQLSSLGKGMVEAAIRNLGLSFGGGAASILGGYFGPTLRAASGFFSSIASIGLLIGFLLYYLLPFLPFLYFMFAVGGWVKGIFEAMVGVPLWALAHIRIDGQGLPGDAALNGYYLIFEIFIRPILIVFGLLASILIFGAMVKVLNEIFSLVVSNLSGFDTTSGACGTDSAAAGSGATPTSGGGTGGGDSGTGSLDFFRGPIDEFFFTIVYAIMVYMIGMSCFKLIDLIPNNILRWMGHGVQTFNDQAGEPAEGLLQKMTIGGRLMGQQLQSAGTQGMQAVGSFAKGAQEGLK